MEITRKPYVQGKRFVKHKTAFVQTEISASWKGMPDKDNPRVREFGTRLKIELRQMSEDEDLGIQNLVMSLDEAKKLQSQLWKAIATGEAYFEKYGS